MFRMLIHPSSGACDLCAELFHGLYWSGSMCVGVTLWFVWGGVVSACSLKFVSLYSTIKVMHGPINIRDQLVIICFIISLFNAQHVSDVNTSILRNLRLICWVISLVVLVWFDVCWCYVVVCMWWCGIRTQDEAVPQASDIKLVSLYSNILPLCLQFPSEGPWVSSSAAVFWVALSCCITSHCDLFVHCGLRAKKKEKSIAHPKCNKVLRSKQSLLRFWVKITAPTTYETHKQVDNTGSSKKMDGIWNCYNLKSTGRIYTFFILKCSERFKVLVLS